MVETNVTQSFEEKQEGYTKHQAIAESARCLMCDDAPCMDGCPANVKVADFLRRIRSGDFIGAAKIIREDNVFGATCARICPSERLCQANCTNEKLDKPVDIPGLQKFACDYQMKAGLKFDSKFPQLDKKVAIVGAGPGGLAAAFELRKIGYQVTVFESEKYSGGMLRAGIPSYRLGRDTVDSEINFILESGVNIQFNKNIGSVEDLKKDFDAVYVSVGLNDEKSLNIPGKELAGVYHALDFLNKKFIRDDIKLGKRVAVLGGGDVAMDCARTAVRLPGVQDVYIVYRRSAKEMPAQDIEVELAQKEGVMFQNLLQPASIEGSGKVEKLVCNQVNLGDPDESGRRRPIVNKDTKVEFAVDNVIFAIGQDIDNDFKSSNPSIELDNKGLIKINSETYETTMPGVFAGGDVTGGTTAVESVGFAKKAVKSIDQYLSRRN